jgi:hypothetical protein
MTSHEPCEPKLDLRLHLSTAIVRHRLLLPLQLYLDSVASGWFRKHNWGAYPRGAQFGCGVAGAAQASY